MSTYVLVNSNNLIHATPIQDTSTKFFNTGCLAGNIYTKTNLDRELTDTYSLPVVVSDQGLPLSNSASATITIKAFSELSLL